MPDALEQAIHDRRPSIEAALCIMATGAGDTYRSNAWPKQGSSPWPAALGTDYSNALAETINGLCKAEVIHRRGPRRSFEGIEMNMTAFARAVQLDRDVRMIVLGGPKQSGRTGRLRDASRLARAEPEIVVTVRR